MAFKASSSPQHQHCTDDAQDPCLTLLRSVLLNVTDTFSFVFAVMPFARSVLLHFPEEIHRTQGVSEVAPQLLQALDVENIAAVLLTRDSLCTFSPLVSRPSRFKAIVMQISPL